MVRTLEIDAISPKDFDDILSRYETTVREDLKELETLRLKTIPDALAKRRSGDTEPYLEKAELEQLVEWKLKHGTYRPKLAQLVASNSAEDIKKTIQTAFQLYANGEPEKLLPTLAALKGVGPATASLVGASYDPANLPFFSDELFRWAHWDGQGEGIKKVGQGWKRAIGYTAKEYRSLCERVAIARKRLREEGRETPAIEMEKVAYVLGKEGVEVSKLAHGQDGGKETSAPTDKSEKPTRKRKRDVDEKGNGEHESAWFPPKTKKTDLERIFSIPG